MKRVAFLSIVSVFMIVAPVVLAAPVSARAVCQSWDAHAACEFGSLRVQNNAWSGDHGPERLTARSPGRWQVLTKQPNLGGAVQTYPDTEIPYYRNNGMPYHKLKRLMFRYSEKMPKSGYDAEAAADIWTSNPDAEIMAWVDNHGQTPAGKPVGTFRVYDGSRWTLWQDGKDYLAFVRQGHHPHGVVHVLSLLQILVRTHRLPASFSIDSAQFGWEICWTHGWKTFKMLKFKEWTKT